MESGTDGLLEVPLPAARLEAALRHYAPIVQHLRNVRDCVRCRQRFSHWHSLGRHPCATHPGRLRVGGAGGAQPQDASRLRWDCCNTAGAQMRFHGCAPADHLEAAESVGGAHNAFTHRSVVCVPLLVYRLMPQPAPALHAAGGARVHHRRAVAWHVRQALWEEAYASLGRVACRRWIEADRERAEAEAEEDEDEDEDAERGYAAGSGRDAYVRLRSSARAGADKRYATAAAG
jgi:hypothetical protein